jgi:glyoxylase-like metal-dependent hydrolase (beta-lactamase superfamily II)
VIPVTVTAASVRVDPVVDEGLGNSSYLVDLGDGSALAVDPPRDLRAVRATAHRRGLRIRFVADTHLHADFLSGAAQLGHDEGAQVLASAAGRRGFEHRGLVDGEQVDLGGLTLAALVTAGHTDEHMSYLLLDGSSARAPLGVFTGGSLIVGSAARTDLLGDERTEELAHAQYRSLRRLATLPAPTAVWPTHGAGSFCSAPPGAERTSTIGAELASNPLLQAPDSDAFVAALLGSLGRYPPYFRRLAELNRRGPALLGPGSDRLAALPVDEVRWLQAEGAMVIDVRPIARWADAHIPGALSIPLRPQFATWLGWLAPPDVPLVVLRDPDQDAADLLWQALKIGYERLVGELAGGISAWIAAAQPTARTELVTADRIGERAVLDVRQGAEFAAGHLPGARHIELGALARLGPAADRPPEVPTVVMCGHGERAAGAASLLERAGCRDVAVLTGGPAEWAHSSGQNLETAP